MSTTSGLLEWPLYGAYLSLMMSGSGAGAASFSGGESLKAVPATELGDEIADTDDER